MHGKNERATTDPTAAPLKKLDAAVIAPKHTRRYRAAAFQVFVLAAAGGFVVLAVAARVVPYFAVDLRVTRALQSYHGVVFDRLMYGVSWIGFLPQSVPIGLLPCIVLIALGLRWEAIVALLAAASEAMDIWIKAMVHRPRPSIDLVHVIRELTSPAFPSGHVLTITTMCGFLAFLCYTLLKSSWERTLLVTCFALLIVLMGISRIYEGQHWFSDVMGAYLFGSLWLAMTIKVYRWGKTRYFVHQPVAPEVPSTPA
jgi:membrane-associated phospholipid phosphatase